MMDYRALQTKAEQYVRNYFTTHTDARLHFHNLQHTQDVVKAAMQLGDHYQLNERDYAILVTAAWFHDIGYFTEPARHEEIGAGLATDFLKQNDMEDDASFITAVAGCIQATKMPQSPKQLIEEILCDADLFHLGTDNFSDKNSALRKEKEMFRGEKIPKSAWREGNIRFMADHHYFTDYARLLLNDEKQKHLSKLEQKAAEKSEEDKTEKEAAITTTVAAPVPEQLTEKAKKKNRPERGIETMFRITSNNNQRLSDMADNKAHIMITVNSIILSAIISLLLKQLENHPNLAIPTYLTLAVSVSAIIFSILATRPSIPKGKFTPQDMESKTVNLLFFGNFYKMNLDEYADGMHQVMEDKDFLYGSLIRDVYSQGVVLGRKYRLLRISYSIFMFGLIAAVLSFIIASVLYA